MNFRLASLIFILILGVVFISTSHAVLGVPSITKSNTLIDQGQSILFTANQIGGIGVAPYTYNYIVIAFNAQTSSNVIIGNALYTGNGLTSNTFVWTPTGNLYVGNSMFEANVVVTDATTLSTNSIYNSFGYNSALSIPSITSFYNPLTSGASQTFTLTQSGGTPPYQAGLYNVTNTMAIPKGGAFANGTTSIALPSGVDLTGAQTFSVWVNPSSWNSVGFPLILGSRQGCNDCGSAILDQQGGAFRFQVSNAVSHFSTTYTLPATNSWELITAQYDGSSTSNIYVNGVFVATGSSAGLGALAWGTDSFYIGRNPTTPSSFNGSMADVQIYNSVLTPTQIFALYANGLSATPIVSANIVAWYPLNGNANDLSGNNNNGIATSTTYAVRPSYVADIATTGGSNTISFTVNSPTNSNSFSFNVLATDSPSVPTFANSLTSSFTVNAVQSTPTLTLSNTLLDSGQTETFTITATGATAPYQGQLFNLTGNPNAGRFSASNYVDIPNSNSLQLTTSGSVSAWIDPSNYLTSSNWGIIFNRGNWGSGLNDYSIYYQGSSLLEFEVDSPTTSYSFVGSSSATPLNKWSFVTLTWNGVKIVAYVNGVQQGTTSEGGTPTIATFNSFIGESTAGGTALTNGLIADVQVYNAPLSPAQVNGIYANGLNATPINPSNIVAWWELNGNTNDGSGFGNTGLAVNQNTGHATPLTYLPRPSYVTNIITSGGSNTISFVVNSPTNSNTFSFNAVTTDAGFGLANSITNTITVNTLLAPTISPSSPIGYINGQTVTVSSYANTGTLPYTTYNFIVFNSVTNALVANQLGASNTFSFTATIADEKQILEANVIVTDSASSPATGNSINSAQITISATPTNLICINSNPNINSSSVYQNLNGSTLVIFADSNVINTGYYANTVSVNEIVNATGANNARQSTTMSIPSKYYFEYIFGTGTDIFHCQWLPFAPPAQPAFQLSPPLEEGFIGYLFAIFSILLFLIHIVLYKRASRIWVITDILSALFMIFALFYFVFTPIAIQTVSATVSNVPLASGNTIEYLNSTITTQTAQVPVNSYGFILLVAGVSMYVMIMFVLAIYDFIKSRAVIED